MNTIKRLMAVLLVGGAGFGLFVACGGDSDSCTFDADCAEGEACEGTVCVPTCTDAATDCAPGEVCARGVNTDLLVCQLDTANNNNNNNGMTNNTTGTNNPPMPTLYYNVRIQSTASGDAACAVNDPGPDIFGAAVEDSTGAVLGWAEVAWNAVQFEDNEHTDDSMIDGNAPDLGADNCPDMFDGNVVALGCDAESYIIVRFLGSDGNPIGLDATADQVIRVYEWGGQCTTGSIDDTYNVDICTDTMNSGAGDDSSCTIQVLIDAAGEASGDVGGF